MRETGHNNKTFTNVEQMIACDYIEAYQRHIILLKTTQNSLF